eukprot:GHVL01017431.1.p1 GENE.GHVL01017431.1~~GHVL01017431.1.p1  ORF type:complete len:737 (-),score=146.48 GHVL01017431.1:68-2278(-)
MYIFMNIYIYIYISEISVCKIKTGIMKGSGGNKGSVGIRFKLGETDMCFLNVHLQSGSDRVAQRHAQLAKIINESWSDKFHPSVAEHTHSIISGDFNFRIDLKSDTVLRQLDTGDVGILKEYDQSRIASNPLNKHWKEQNIRFFPTYKFTRNTEEYNRERTPSWTDRIFYHAKNLPSAPHGMLQPKCYDSLMSYGSSDHKPVYALFRLMCFVEDKELLNSTGHLTPLGSSRRLLDQPQKLSDVPMEYFTKKSTRSRTSSDADYQLINLEDTHMDPTSPHQHHSSGDGYCKQDRDGTVTVHDFLTADHTPGAPTAASNNLLHFADEDYLQKKATTQLLDINDSPVSPQRSSKSTNRVSPAGTIVVLAPPISRNDLSSNTTSLPSIRQNDGRFYPLVQGKLQASSRNIATSSLPNASALASTNSHMSKTLPSLPYTGQSTSPEALAPPTSQHSAALPASSSTPGSRQDNWPISATSASPYSTSPMRNTLQNPSVSALSNNNATPALPTSASALPNHSSAAALPYNSSAAALPYNSPAAALPHNSSAAALPPNSPAAALPPNSPAAALSYNSSAAALPANASAAALSANASAAALTRTSPQKSTGLSTTQSPLIADSGAGQYSRAPGALQHTTPTPFLEDDSTAALPYESLPMSLSTTVPGNAHRSHSEKNVKKSITSSSDHRSRRALQGLAEENTIVSQSSSPRKPRRKEILDSPLVPVYSSKKSSIDDAWWNVQDDS